MQRAIITLEPRFTARVLRSLTGLRKRLDRESLLEIVGQAYPDTEREKATKTKLIELINLLPTAESKAEKTKQNADEMEVEAEGHPTTSVVADATSMDVDAPKEEKPEKKEKEAIHVGGDSLPEGDVYLRLLVILGLLDVNALNEAADLALSTVQLISSLNRRSMDHLAAKVYFYLARVHELLGRDKEEEIRPLLLAAQSTASLRQDADLQGTLINLLLRNYFNFNLYDQADKLISKVQFPESSSNAQLARYLFYLGRIRAVQLNYTESHTHLQHAIRRAPPASVAPGFVQTVHKFFVVVELLMGDIPERSIFRQPVLKQALLPYFQIVQGEFPTRNLSISTADKMG